VGLERSPLSLVRITEELLERKVAHNLMFGLCVQFLVVYVLTVLMISGKPKLFVL
jgi:hypothetical protein